MTTRKWKILLAVALGCVMAPCGAYADEAEYQTAYAECAQQAKSSGESDPARIEEAIAACMTEKGFTALAVSGGR